MCLVWFWFSDSHNNLFLFKMKEEYFKVFLFFWILYDTNIRTKTSFRDIANATVFHNPSLKAQLNFNRADEIMLKCVLLYDIDLYIISLKSPFM